ncbi:hypothetical protein [Mesorhizobium carmichaelinearum]|uniref:hypothetical protein n=1 Tax=Mesorhizobium carmichaelinearum TaxID=1208188 RepID=UPI000BA4B6F0|nr:hypothetical protein [Mesorhizobium carmichaelinearum]
MGSGRWSSTDWNAYATAHVSGKSAAHVFKARTLDPTYDPKMIQVRESRDSADNPASTPIILASDVTGSMGMVAHQLMKDGLNTLAQEIYARKPVSDPHVMMMAVGDVECDQAPLQVTQFEADIRLADQVRGLWIEGGGGGNSGESYCGAHYFAATKTVSDAWEKRRKKGYLFTIGDEPVLDGMRGSEVSRVFGGPAKNVSAAECIAMASRTYEVFHVILKNEGYAKGSLARVLASWQPLLPQRLILLDDVTKLAEAVVSTIQVAEGASKSTVAASWNGSTAVTVANAIKDIATLDTSGAVRLA